MKKKIVLKSLTALFFVFVLLFVSCDMGGGGGSGEPYITSPYSSVDWVNWEQYKASLHTHTSNSDGSGTLSATIERHYTLGFDILAITDHNWEHDAGTPSARWQPFTDNWLLDENTPNGLTAARRNQIRAGFGRDGRGMLEIPNSSEIAAHPDEFNAFFTFNIPLRTGGNLLRPTIRQANDINAIMFINHPGRATGGNAVTAWGPFASNLAANINKYASLYLEFPNLIGMEVVNRIRDGDSRNDRILWDNVNKVTIPRGKFVWGFSNDDSHSVDAIGHNYNMFLMPENNLANVRSAMINGNFYAVARVAHNEGVNSALSESNARAMLGQGIPFPRITSIEICNFTFTITINAENANKIEWISDGKIITTETGAGIFPSTFGLLEENGDFKEGVGIFVRANIIGPGGIAFTQPFGVRK
jgi:hypothetical protein